MPEHSHHHADATPLHPDDTRSRALLRALHEARDRGDQLAARGAWAQLVLAEVERVRGIAAGVRVPSLPGARIAEGDVDEVVYEVFERLHERIDVLRGDGVGELRTFMRTATKYVCADHVARVARTDHDPPGDDEPAASAITRSALDALAASLVADNEEAEFARAMVHPALALVEPEERMVLVMDQAGYSTDDIQERLGLSRDAVFQRRRRGNLQLRDAIAELAEDEADA